MVKWMNAAFGVIEEIRRKFQGNDQEIFLILLFHNEMTMDKTCRLQPIIVFHNEVVAP